MHLLLGHNAKHFRGSTVQSSGFASTRGTIFHQQLLRPFFSVLNNFWAVQIISLRRCILGRKTGLLFRHIHSQLPECTALYGWCILSITMTLQLQGHLRMLLQMTPRDGNPRSQSQCQTQLTLQSITYDSLGTPLCDKPHAQSNPREL